MFKNLCNKMASLFNPRTLKNASNKPLDMMGRSKHSPSEKNFSDYGLVCEASLYSVTASFSRRKRSIRSLICKNFKKRIVLSVVNVIASSVKSQVNVLLL